MFSFEQNTKNQPHRTFQKTKTIEEYTQSRHSINSLLSKKKRDDFIRQKRKRIVDSKDAKKDFNINDILDWVKEIKNMTNEDTVTCCVEYLRISFAFDAEKPTQLSLQYDIIPNLVSFLSTTNAKLIFSTIWVLTNLSAVSHEATNIMTEKGVIYPLVNLLNIGNDELKEQVLWALCNISGDSTNSRDLILQANVVPIIVNIVKNSEQLELMSLISWFIMNLCRDNSDYKSISPLLDCIRRLIYYEDNEVICNICYALNFMSNNINANINDIIESGTCKRLVELLDHQEVRIKLPSLRTIGNILSGDDNQVQVLINLNVLNGLTELISINSSSLIKEVCWAISNITAGSNEHIKLVVDQGIIPRIIQISKTDERETRKEALMVIINALACTTSMQIIEYFVSKGAMESLTQVFEWKDYPMVLCVLEVVESILKYGQRSNKFMKTLMEELDCAGIVYNIQSLMMDKNDQVSELAEKINQKYFENYQMEIL